MPSRTTTLPRLVACAAVLAVAFGWWWMHGRATSTPPTGSTAAGRPPVATPPVSPSTATRDADAVTVNSKRPARPLPPDDTPLADVFDELKARADAGDAHAACRLAVDLLECGAVNAREQGQLDGLKTRETVSEKKGNLSEANGDAEMQAQLVTAQQRCARIDAGQLAMAGDDLRNAARAGVPEAMLRYADRQGFGRALGLSALRNPNFDAWRREAPDMMRASLAAGRPGAVLALADAYRTDSETSFSALVPNDVVLARAYYVLYQKLLGKNPPADKPISSDELAQLKRAGVDISAANPTPDQLRRADAEADRLYRLHFRGRPLTDRRSVGSWLTAGPQISAVPDPTAQLRCN